jgi:hypothetical protein
MPDPSQPQPEPKKNQHRTDADLLEEDKAAKAMEKIEEVREKLEPRG